MNPFTGSGALLERLKYNAEEYGDQVAVSDGSSTFTWKELRDAARAVAVHLPFSGKAAPVGVFAERRSDTLVLFYAVLYSGNFYIPFDPEMPASRLDLIRENAGFELVLGCGDAPELFDKEQWLDCSDWMSNPQLSEQQETALQAKEMQDAQAPLYLVYTSGSTGVPKGVLKQAGAMESFVTAFLKEYPLHPQDVIGNQTPFFFDASAKDIYWSLFSGCRLEIIPSRLFSFPVDLLKDLNAKRVTVISWVPSALSIVSQLDAFSCVKPETLRAVFFVGEVFPAKQLKKWREALPDVVFVNLYGSSEIAGVCCHCRIERDFSAEESLPLGVPFSHCRITLQGENGPVEAPNQEGELLIESPALALEYYHDPERSAKVFTEKDGVRTLHTGDMAMYNEAGQLVFTSRRDFQIKHMGYRIELGEIEVAAAALDAVAFAGCIYDTRRSRIILYVQLTEGAQNTDREILGLLRTRLCSYMLPQKIFIVEQIPLNRNGKIDRPALQQLYAAAPRRRRPNGKGE